VHNSIQHSVTGACARQHLYWLISSSSCKQLIHTNEHLPIFVEFIELRPHHARVGVRKLGANEPVSLLTHTLLLLLLTCHTTAAIRVENTDPSVLVRSEYHPQLHLETIEIFAVCVSK